MSLQNIEFAMTLNQYLKGDSSSRGIRGAMLELVKGREAGQSLLVETVDNEGVQHQVTVSDYNEHGFRCLSLWERGPEHVDYTELESLHTDM